MMKRIIVLVWVALFLTCLTAYAGGDGAPLAAPAWDVKSLEKYPSFALDESTGEWSVRSLEADALARFFTEQAPSYSGGLCAFYLELAGNERLNLATPSLVVMYFGSKQLNATAIAILSGNERYVFPVTAEAQNGAQVMRIPLDDQSLPLISALADAGKVDLRILGDYKYTMEAELSSKYANNKKKIEAMSLLTLKPMLSEPVYGEGLSEYALWDLTRDRWEAKLGYTPRMVTSEVSAGSTVNGIALDEDWGLLSPGDSGASVKTLETQLIKVNLMTGTADNSYAPATARAVRSAQKFVGDVQTGAADKSLIEKLFSNSLVPAAAEASADGALPEEIKDVIKLRADRYWYARSVAPSFSSDLVAARSAGNADDMLLVVDGEMQNVGTQSLDMTWQLSASLVSADGYTYPATVVCERDEGTGFDGTLLPLARARMVVYAEIPRAAISSSWSLTLTSGEESATFVIGQ